MITIALGSIRQPKVEAVKSAFAKIYPDKEVRIITEKVNSDVDDQPRDLEETTKGAYNRAQNLIKAAIKADYYIGIEGGVMTHHFLNKEKFFLTGAVYITDGKIDSLAYSETLELSDYARREIMDKQRELAPVAEEMFSKKDVRGTNGTIGELTNDLITRSQSFENGIIMAMVKFYNTTLYNNEK